MPHYILSASFISSAPSYYLTARQELKVHAGRRLMSSFMYRVLPLSLIDDIIDGRDFEHFVLPSAHNKVTISRAEYFSRFL